MLRITVSIGVGDPETWSGAISLFSCPFRVFFLSTGRVLISFFSGILVYNSSRTPSMPM